MKITELKVRKTFDEGVRKAVVTVVFDDCLAVHDIKVVDTGTKRMVVMPAVKTAEGRFRDTVHPMNSQFRSELVEAVFEAVDTAKVVEEVMASER